MLFLLIFMIIIFPEKLMINEMSHDLDQRIEGITKGNISKSQW